MEFRVGHRVMKSVEKCEERVKKREKERKRGSIRRWKINILEEDYD